MTSAAAGYRDRTPLPADVTGASSTAGGAAHAAASSGGGGAALRMLLGLAIVIAVIYVLYRVLKRASDRNGKSVRPDGWMNVVASTPLAQSRSLHLVRIGDELVLVGSAEGGVTPIRVYTAEEARRLGVDPDLVGPLPLAPGPYSQAPARRGGGRIAFGSALVEELKRRTAR